MGNTDIKYDKIIDSDVYLIKSEYKVLLMDEDPIICTGLNGSGIRVVSSIIEDNDEERFFRYFQLLIPNNEMYEDFINGKTTLLSLVEMQGLVTFADFNYDKTVKGMFKLFFDEIPIDWLPLKKSYFKK